MRIFIASLLLFLGVQGAPPVQTGAIEGRVVRASNSVPIAGVQITLIPPVAPAQPANTGTTGVQPIPVPIQAPPGTTIQITRGPDGNAQIIQTSPTGAVTTQTVAIDALGNLQLPGAAPRNQNTVVTDGDGRFSFQNLAPGMYTIRAQRDGYFGPMSPQGAYPAAIAKPVTVENDKRVAVDFGMVQAGVLRGLLRDPDGQPAANYAVVIARPGYVNGRYVWLLGGARNADDRGEYRWPGLPPGEYFVGSGPRAPGPIANVQDSWARVFAPGVIDPNQARSVTIAEGGETTVNLNAVQRSWNVFKISGVAVNPLPTLPSDPVTGVVNRAVNLVLMPLDLKPMDNPPVSSWTGNVAITTKPNGDYLLTNVDPGRYDLYAMANDQQNRRIWTGRVRVEVQDRDITGLNITVSPGVTLRGEVAITGSANLRPENVRIQLQALGSLPPQVATAIGPVPVDEFGKFEIANLSAGRYRMNVANLPQTAYTASIQQGGINIYNDGFDVDTQQSQVPIRVEINTAGETVEGNVRVSGQTPAPNAVVVLVPAPDRRNIQAYYKTATTDEKGHFTLRGVAPGSYTAFAWEWVLPGAFQNAEFIEKHLSRGRLLTVQGGVRSELQLDLIKGN